MARFLRQSTTATIKMGPFVSPSDGLTPFASGGFTVKLAANGGALAPRNDATAIAYDADGFYNVELNATDTATIGRLKAEVAGSTGNYLPVWDDFVILSGAVYDVLFGTVAPSTYAGGAVASVTGNVGGNVVGSVGSVTGAVGSVTGNVGGNVVGSVASVTAAVTVSLAQALNAARDVGAVADTSLTLNDAFHCAIAAAAGKESVVSTTFTVMTPSTGTTLRTFTLDSSSAPTSRT